MMRVERQESRVESRRRQRPPHGWRCVRTLNPQPSTLNPRSAFTLTELLVVMVIMTLLTTMTVYAVNFSLAAERSRAAARQVQSYLAGARDRAIYERRPVGVRFLIDPDVANTASSMVFVEKTAAPKGGASVTQQSSSVWQVTRTSGGLSWSTLVQRELLVPGARIKVDDGTTTHLFFIQGPLDPSDNRKLNAAMPLGLDTLAIAPDPAANITGQYELELVPVVRPNQEPILLPRGIVVDLDRSQLPDFWRQSGTYIDRLDIMFSPRGTATGQAASTGLIHLYLAETADVERIESARVGGTYPERSAPPFFPAVPRYIPSDTPYGLNPDDDLIGDRVIVSLFPQTGAVSSHPVDPTPFATSGNNAKIARSPYRYAELGEVAAE